MNRRWVTASSTTFEAMVNPIAAACDDGYVPDEYHILVTPGSANDVERAVPLIETTVAEYGGDLDVTCHTLDDEMDFATIVEYYRSAIQTATKRGDAVAVDVTPGRKFMSAIAFRAGLEYDATHVYYLFLDSSDFYGQAYDAIPRPAISLVDFTEVVG